MPTLRTSITQPAPAAHAKSNNESVKLINVMQRRKQADRDIQLLQNRVKMLQKEEEKALRKINTTKAKCAMIVKIREENERRVQERLRALQEERAQVEIARASHYQIEDKSKLSAQRKLQSIEEKRREGVVEIKNARRFIKEDVSLQRNIILERKKEQRATIKAAEKEARKIRELKRAKVLEQARQLYEVKIKKEEEEAIRREKEVLKMEKLEMELIQQLKSTQMLQKAALNELENALQINNP